MHFPHWDQFSWASYKQQQNNNKEEKSQDIGPKTSLMEHLEHTDFTESYLLVIWTSTNAC